MSKLNRLTGRFPVFASGSKLGSIQTVNNKVTDSEYPNYYLADMLGFKQGFNKEPNKEQLNGVLNFITNAISDIQTFGIPAFTLNIAYPKGAVVSFNGNLYISLCDKNTTHISQKYAWGKVLTEQYEPILKDTNPIGTILTVPKTVTKEGYIDYVEGSTFNSAIYPDLYRVLGTDTFSITGVNGYSDLPIGTVIHLLSGSTDVPQGFIEWTGSTYLHKYPELKEHLTKMAYRMTDYNQKQEWLNCLKDNRLPSFYRFYLGQGESGELLEDTTRAEELLTCPVIVDESKTLNPLGIKRCLKDTTVKAVVLNHNVRVAQADATVFVSGLNPENVATDILRKQISVVVGNGEVTRPRTLSTRVLVKAVTNVPSAISSTHKQIIKAF